MSGLLAHWFGAGLPPYGLMLLLHLVRPEDALAGNFPDFTTLILGRFLFLLALLSFSLAALSSFFEGRQSRR